MEIRTANTRSKTTGVGQAFSTGRNFSHTNFLMVLPDELLIAIVRQISGLPRQQRRDLVQVSLVCRLLGSLAREELLSNPVVHLCDTRALIRTYMKYPNLVSKVQSLEIIAYGRISFEHDDTGHWDTTRPTLMLGFEHVFQDACAAIIAQSHLSTESKRECVFDMKKNHDSTFLAVLILMLPKLTDLRCGTPLLNSLSMFKALYPHVDANDYLVRSEGSFFKKQYMGDVLRKLAPFLRTLELPCHWRGRRTYLSLPPVGSFLMFTSLKHLSLPIDAVPLYTTTFTSEPHSWNYDQLKGERLHLFPPTLETLKLLVTYDPRVTNFVRSITCSKVDYPTLKHITIIHNLDTGGQMKFKEDELLVLMGKKKGIDICFQYRSAKQLRDAFSRPLPNLNTAVSTIETLSESEIIAYEARDCYVDLAKARHMLDGELTTQYGKRRRELEASKCGRKLDKTWRQMG